MVVEEELELRGSRTSVYICGSGTWPFFDSILRPGFLRFLRDIFKNQTFQADFLALIFKVVSQNFQLNLTKGSTLCKNRCGPLIKN